MWAWVEVQGWQQRPAHILSVDLISQPGDDSTTYRVETLYEYSFRGERFTSDRVTLTSGSDNVGSFHHDVHRELSRHQQSGSLFRCYVDPEDPTRAILYREIRPGLLGLKAIFALVFGGAGFGLIGLALRGKKKVKAQEDLRQLYPEEPWRWREEWAEGRVPASSKANMIGTSVIAIFWNLISLPLLFIVPEEIRGGNLLASIGLLFPAMGAGMALWALRLFIQWRKFGHSVFEMSEVPGVTGGLLQGQILTGTHIQPQEDIRLTLNCVERRTTGSGKNRSTSETILWQDTQLIRREALDYRSRGCAIPVRFGIPYQAQPATRVQAEEFCGAWRQPFPCAASTTRPSSKYRSSPLSKAPRILRPTWSLSTRARSPSIGSRSSERPELSLRPFQKGNDSSSKRPAMSVRPPV